MAISLSGKLLIAAPELVDPNFVRTVVLLLEHDDEEGALGVVLNRPTDAPVADYLPEWAPHVAVPPLVFAGGPVTPEVALGVADSPGVPPEAWAPVLGTIGLVDMTNPPETFAGVRRIRVFSGYAGWVSGQLEAELAIRSWFVVDAVADDVFSAEPEGLWRAVLRRQPDVLSWYANYPSDLSVN